MRKPGTVIAYVRGVRIEKEGGIFSMNTAALTLLVFGLLVTFINNSYGVLLNIHGANLGILSLTFAMLVYLVGLSGRRPPRNFP
jgi:hypothetical protein